MWLKSTEGQWINSDHIVRIYLHDVREPPGFDAVEEEPVLGRKAVLDLANGHSAMLAYFSNKGDIEAQSAQFGHYLRHALQQNEAYLDFEELGYEQMPPETGWAGDHPFQAHGHE